MNTKEGAFNWKHGGEDFFVIVSKELEKWHLSISHKSRALSYEEIKAARYELLPDGAYMAMIFPPKSEFVNIHPFCFHLYEI